MQAASIPAPSSGALAADARALLIELYGPEVEIASWTKLNVKREICVSRLTLRHARVPSVIAKHYAAELYQHPSTWPQLIDFDEELLGYRFLMADRARFDAFPRLLASRRGLFLLDDLGPDSFEFDSVEQIVASIADTLVDLHTATAGREREYLELRRQHRPDADTRKYGVEGCASMFDKGCAMLADFAGLLGCCSPSQFVELVAPIRRRILDPGRWAAFAHDDLADRRQSVVVDGRLMLLDFEHGKFFHRLIDIAKPLIGKVEHSSVVGAMIYHHPHIPIRLAEVYRERWRARGAEVSDEEWREHIGAALVFQTLMVVGRLHELSGGQLALPMARSLRELLTRLCGHLHAVGGALDFAELADAMRARIFA